MPRIQRAAALLAAFLTLASAAPGLVPSVAAASCSGWTSSSTPPPTIRVYRHASGVVDTVDFKTYAKNVLSREWIASWTTESLRSGALAVKHYAWYQVLHWRGGVNADNACFDLRDDTVDQVYDPSRATYTTAAAAVDATWTTRVLKNGAIFPTYYNAGSSGEACGANANGWKMYQWGTQACGLAGRTAAQIMLTYYYPNVTVTDAPTPTSTPAPTPTASPTPTPRPTPTPTATPKPSATPTGAPTATAGPTNTPRPTSTPAPTLAPTSTPTATPLPTPSVPLATPPPEQALPGGGQSGVDGQATPPPPPPDDPEPSLVRPRHRHHPAADSPVDRSAARFSAWMFEGPVPSPGAQAATFAHGVESMTAGTVISTDDLAAMLPLWRAALDNLERALLRHLAAARVASFAPTAGLP